MNPIEIAITLCLMLASPQEYTVNASLTANQVTVQWTAPVTHDTRDWIALYRVGAPAEPAPAQTYWQYVPPGTSGSVTLPAPTEPGEYEARYLLRNSFELAATSAKIVVGGPPDDTPVLGAPSRLRKLTYYENGVRLWETETMDDTEAARHIANFSLRVGKGVDAKIEVRFARVEYGVLPDEIGTWKK